MRAAIRSWDEPCQRSGTDRRIRTFELPLLNVDSRHLVGYKALGMKRAGIALAKRHGLVDRVGAGSKRLVFRLKRVIREEGRSGEVQAGSDRTANGKSDAAHKWHKQQ